MGYAKNCVLCTNPAREKLTWVLGQRVSVVLPLCWAHAKAVDNRDWTLVVRSADLTSAISGAHAADVEP